MKLWAKYLIKELLKSFIFFLCSIYIIYVLIDFSTYSIRFFKNINPLLPKLLTYYFHQFILISHLFLPLAFMLTIIKVFFSMQKRHETTPLLLAGISKMKLLMPAGFFAIALSLFSYISAEYALPLSQGKIAEIKAHRSKSYRSDRSKVSSITLTDGSTIIYQKKEGKTLHDLFWIKEPLAIWHMKSLELTKPYKGCYVDEFQKNSDHQLIKVASYEEKEFPSIASIRKKSSHSIPYESRSLSLLIKQSFSSNNYSSKERASISTHLHYKLVMALLPCLLVISLPPFLLTFERDKKIFRFTAIAIASFISLYTLQDALFILGENQVITPSVALWSPFLLLSLFFSKRVFSHY